MQYLFQFSKWRFCPFSATTIAASFADQGSRAESHGSYKLLQLRFFSSLQRSLHASFVFLGLLAAALLQSIKDGSNLRIVFTTLQKQLVERRKEEKQVI